MAEIDTQRQPSSGRRVPWVAIAIAALLGLGIGSLAWYLTPAGERAVAGDATIGGPFDLVAPDGRRVTDADFADRIMVVYFGYTYCPDICPLGLQTITAAIDQLEPNERAAVVPVFISIDPARDTPEAMGEYAGLFGDDLVALTGTQAEIDEVARAYRVYHAKVPAESGDGDAYLMDHSAFMYVMGPDGEYLSHFGPKATADEVAAGLREALNGEGLA